MSGPVEFTPGLRLGRMLFEQAGRAIIESIVPREAYAAGFLGKGSDVLGYDSERSTDHDWGPRFLVFLPDDRFERQSRLLDEELSRRLPALFNGYPVGAVESEEFPARPHRVQIETVRGFLCRHLGVEDLSRIGVLDWLTFPEQRLLELTSGELFHDPRKELTRFREILGAYPVDVWVYRMACQWQRLSQEEAFVGRCSEAGDEVGMRLAAARVVRDVMKLCFLMERIYAPYDKWLGTAFGKLTCASRMQPLMATALDAGAYDALEPILVKIYRNLGEMHNSLHVTGPMDAAPRQFYTRPYTVMRADRFANALLNAVQSEELRRIPVRMGAIDQLVDNTDFIEHAETYRKVLPLYE